MANVIVVDDDDAVRGIIMRIVVAEGHTVRGAPDGAAASKLMSDLAADLIISDVYMPKMDGIEVLIRLQNEFPRVRIIVMSGGGSIGTRDVLDIAASLGARATLAKPISHSQLRDAIAKALA